MLPRVPIGHGFPDPHPLLKRTAFGALVGGDMSGNTRGSNALDIQSTRSAVTQVASGQTAAAVGLNNTASATQTSAIGVSNTASATQTSAIGVSNTASAYQSSAVGYSCSVSAQNSAAIGNACSTSGASVFSGSAAIGAQCSASGNYGSAAIGIGCTASGNYSSAIGLSCTASANYSFAFGYACQATVGNSCAAIGVSARARIANTTNICGPQIVRKDNGESAGSAFRLFCGVEVMLATKEIDLKVVAEHTITIPAGAHFWITEVGLWVTSINTMTVQPTVRFGITGTPAKHLAATLTTNLTAQYKRQTAAPLVPNDGETGGITFGVTGGATATTMKGRAYFRGILVEDE